MQISHHLRKKITNLSNLLARSKIKHKSVQIAQTGLLLILLHGLKHNFNATLRCSVDLFDFLYANFTYPFHKAAYMQPLLTFKKI